MSVIFFIIRFMINLYCVVDIFYYLIYDNFISVSFSLFMINSSCISAILFTRNLTCYIHFVLFMMYPSYVNGIHFYSIYDKFILCLYICYYLIYYKFSWYCILVFMISVIIYDIFNLSYFWYIHMVSVISVFIYDKAILCYLLLSILCCMWFVLLISFFLFNLWYFYLVLVMSIIFVNFYFCLWFCCSLIYDKFNLCLWYLLLSNLL